MIDNNAIRLIGYPVIITIPGEADDEYERLYMSPDCSISGEQIYKGYALCDLECPYDANIYKIYLEYTDGHLYRLTDWFDNYYFDTSKYIKKEQSLVTYGKMQAVALLLWNHIQNLYEELDKKENCRENDY